jgi:ArsR family transcriptional regulator
MQKKKRTKSSERRRSPSHLGLENVLNARLFRALGDPTRAKLVSALAECCGPRTVGEAASCCTVDLSVVSRHLALLKEAGVLQARKQGRQTYYSVRCSELADSLRLLADALDACCPPAADGGS